MIMNKNDEKLQSKENLPIDNMEVLNDELVLIKGGRGALSQDKIEQPGGGNIGCHCNCG